MTGISAGPAVACARPRGPTAWLWALPALGLALGLLAFPAVAQPVRVTAGEHAGFTRVVLQAAGGFDWQIDDQGRSVRIRVSDHTIRLDREQLFLRIPRTRLSEARLVDGELELVLACDCPVRAWLDRAGVLVLDIADAGPGPAAAELMPVPSPPPPARNPASADPGRAGRALAAAWRSGESAPVAGADEPDRFAPLPDPRNAAGIAADLAQHLASAMTRGVADPAGPAAPGRGRLSDAPPQALPLIPPNIRFRAAEDPDRAQETESPPDGACPAASVAGFALQTPAEGFAAGLARIHGDLYGEFDQPVADSLLHLAEHYLVWGFGAEARQALDFANTPIEGRDVLIAIADLLETRQTNARHRLAGLIACPTPLPLFAALAGAPAQAVQAAADRIVTGFLDLSPALRTALGPGLVERLVDAGATDAARMIRDALERTAGQRIDELDRLAAVIDRARGDDDRAARRLDAGGDNRIETLQLRLQIALERGEFLPEALLDDAVTIAESQRSAEAGRRLLELVILQHAAAGRSARGLVLLDQLSGWLGANHSAHERLAPLRNRLWLAAAGLPDAELLELALTRQDWQAADIAAETRSALATRFATLGLQSLARTLLQGSDSGSPLDPDPSPTPEAPQAGLPPDAGLPPLQEPGTGTGLAAGGMRLPATPLPGNVAGPVVAALPGGSGGGAAGTTTLRGGGDREADADGGQARSDRVAEPVQPSATLSPVDPGNGRGDFPQPQPESALLRAQDPAEQQTGSAAVTAAEAAPVAAAAPIPTGDATGPASGAPPVVALQGLAATAANAENARGQPESTGTGNAMQQGLAALDNTARLRTLLGETAAP